VELSDKAKNSALHKFLIKKSMVRKFERNFKCMTDPECKDTLSITRFIYPGTIRAVGKTPEECKTPCIYYETYGNSNEALNYAFDWESTPEGEEFWSRLNNMYFQHIESDIELDINKIIKEVEDNEI